MRYINVLCVKNLPTGGLTEMEIYEIGIRWKDGAIFYELELDSGAEILIDDLTFESHFVEEW